jgi:hypothetical protein
MWRFWVRSSVALALGVTCFHAGSMACGPHFPSSIIADEESMLAAPVASFEHELKALLPSTPVPVDMQFPALPDGEAPPVAPEYTDLETALKEAGTAEETRDALVNDYIDTRKQLAAYLESQDRDDDFDGKPDAPSVEPLWAISAGLPVEFADYLRGAIAYRLGRVDEARQHWLGVLALPKQQRRYRSVWAAYMLGKSWLEEAPAKAVKWFVETRQLARSGFHDSQRLAVESIGWQARAELNRNRFKESVGLYLVQKHYEHRSAVNSLSVVAEVILGADDDVLAGALEDETLRRLVMARLASQGRNTDVNWPQILVILENNTRPNTPGADRLAWIAYQQGDMKLTEQWLDRADNRSAITQWIRAKMLLRDGKPAEAAALLSKLVRRLSDTPDLEGVTMEHWDRSGAWQQLQGELATLRLSGNQFGEALRLLIEADYPMDAGYVAERVLTVDELMAFVDREYPGETLDFFDPSQHDQALAQRNIENREDVLQAKKEAEDAFTYRFLAARRLAREGRFMESRRYLPPNLQPKLDEFLNLKQRGYNTSFDRDDRVASLWAAAELMRWYGWVLTGTEVEPDWYTLGCQYELGGFLKKRSDETKPAWLRATDIETRRATTSAVRHELRFHYRYEAAMLAWDAADLYPAQSDEAAAMLDVAANWLWKSDPQLSREFKRAARARLTDPATTDSSEEDIPQTGEDTDPSIEPEQEETDSDTMIYRDADQMTDVSAPDSTGGE